MKKNSHSSVTIGTLPGLAKKTVSASFVIMLTGGYGYTLYSALLPFVISEHGIDYQQAGMVLSVQSIGLCLASLLSGPLCRKLKQKPTIIIGLFLLIGGGLAVIQAKSIAFLYVAAFAFGSGHGVNNNITNALVNDTSNHSTSVLNLLHACYSLGCVFTPMAVWLSLRLPVGWRGGAWFCIILCAISLVACFRMPLPRQRAQEKSSVKDTRWYTQKRYYILTLLLFIGVGIQNGVMGWSTTFFVEMRLLNEAQAQQLLLIMWLTMICGRLFFSRITRNISNERLLAYICGACCLLMFCSIPLLSSPWLALIFILMGFALSGLYPLVVSSAGSFIEHNTTASGLLFAFGSAGGMITSFLCGSAADNFGMRYSFVVVMIISVAAVFTTMLNSRWSKSNG